jgi:tellurite methyltransferase
MNSNDQTRFEYDQKYGSDAYYWGVRPSASCFEVLKRMPPDRPLKLLDVGCGEGRDAIFFARNGYQVHAFDFSERGVQKTSELAKKAGVHLEVFQADLNVFLLDQRGSIGPRKKFSIACRAAFPTNMQSTE